MLLVTLQTILELDPEAEEEEVDDALGPLLAAVAGLCLVLGILIIGLILMFVGVIYLIMGREEFGKEHSDYVMKGFILFIIGFVIYLVASGISEINGPVGSVIGIGAAICFGIGLYFLIFHLSDDKGKNWLRGAAAVYIVFSIISVVLIIWLFTTLDLYDVQGSGFGDTNGDTAVADKAMAALMIEFGLGALSLIPLLIFFMAYRRVHRRLKDGEIQPVTPVIPPGIYPPGQAPQYPPVYPGGYPPPPEGPQQYPPPQGYPQPQYPQAQPPVVVAQPVPSTPQHAAGSKNCMYCGSEIPASSNTCPVCKKNL
jgi:hypothetical protein